MRRLLTSCVGVVLLAGLPVLLAACHPKPPQTPPPRLPPREVPHLQNLNDTVGERSNVVDDAVQVGSNLAHIALNCAGTFGKNIEGGGALSATLTRCEFNSSSKTVVLASDGPPNGSADCPAFLLTLNDYHGAGTYNTSSLGPISFGTAKLHQKACGWDGDLCLNWNGASGPHADTSCTVEINSDGGLQYGTTGAVVSGTFVCSAFTSPYKGCEGNAAVAACGVTRASFSVAGCATISDPAPQQVAPKKRGKRTQ